MSSKCRDAVIVRFPSPAPTSMMQALNPRTREHDGRGEQKYCESQRTETAADLLMTSRNDREHASVNSQQDLNIDSTDFTS